MRERPQYTYSSSSSIIRYEYSLYVLQSLKWKCGSSSFIFTHPPEDEKTKKRKAYLLPGAVHASTQQTRLYKSEVRASVLRVKTPCEQGLPHCTYVLQAEQRLPSATEEKAKRSFPIERGPTAKHHSAWNPQCTHWFRAEEFPLLPLPYTESHATLQSR